MLDRVSDGYGHMKRTKSKTRLYIDIFDHDQGLDGHPQLE